MGFGESQARRPGQSQSKHAVSCWENTAPGSAGEETSKDASVSEPRAKRGPDWRVPGGPRGRESVQGVWLAGQRPTRLDIRFARNTPGSGEAKAPPRPVLPGARRGRTPPPGGEPAASSGCHPEARRAPWDSPGAGLPHRHPKGPSVSVPEGPALGTLKGASGTSVWASPVLTSAGRRGREEGGGLLPGPASGREQTPRD